MSWQSTPYLFPLFGSTIVQFGLVLYAVLRIARERVSRSLGAVVVLQTAGATWSLAAAYQLANAGAAKVLWFAIGSVGYGTIPLAWFAFAAATTDADEWLSLRRFGPMVGVAVAWVVLHVTYGSHRLFWRDAAVVSNGDFLVLDLAFTPLYYAFVATMGAVTAGGVVLLVRGTDLTRRSRRWRVVAVALSVGLPVVTSAKYYLGVGPHPLVNLTPIAVTVTGAVLAVAVFRYQFLDAIPVARTTVVDVMNEGMVVLDRNDRVEDLNPAAKDLLGASDRAIGAPVERILPAGGDPLGGGPLGDGDGTVEGQWQTTTDDADGRRLAFQVSPLERDRFLGRLLLVRDVTERHRIEQRYQALIEKSSDVFSVLDERGAITYVSPSVERILGFDPDAVVGRDIFELLAPDEREPARAKFRAMLENPGETFRFEHTLLDVTGEPHDFESLGRDLLDNPHVEGVAVVSREITERKERERELERMNERLEDFGAMLSHDLRNPLEVAQIHLTLAQRGDESALETVAEAHDRIDQMIEDILALAREGNQVDDPEVVDLGTVAREAWSTVSTAGATIEVDEATRVVADRSRLLHLFENLFRNAVEHGSTDRADPDGSPSAAGRDASTSPSASPREDDVEADDDRLTVTVGAVEDGFYVADDGRGIPESERSTVFERGYSTAQEGTGFGLSIVRQTAEAHGWDVDVTASSDGGARFEFRGGATEEPEPDADSTASR